MSEKNEIKENTNQNTGLGGHHKNHRRHHRNGKSNRPSGNPLNDQNKKVETESKNNPPDQNQQNQKKNNNAPQNQKNQRHNHKNNNRKNQEKHGEPTMSLLDVIPENDTVFGSQTVSAPNKKMPVRSEEPIEIRQLSDDELFGTSHILYTPQTHDEETVEVVGIRFKPNGKIYYFEPNNFKFSKGDKAVVDTARGMEFGEVALSNRKVKESDIVQPLHPVCRPATKDDIDRNEYNKQKEKDAFKICLDKIAQHGLDMKLVEVQCSFDNSKLLFYFTSAGRVDFRELVRDLASQFKTRIELRQIGIRDEAKLIGGIGICGRPLCCSRHLSNFAQVSIKMAKEQGLSLSSNKISGNCGRLMCCLNYENQTYIDEIKITPMPGSQVKVNGTLGTVTDANPLTGMLKIKLSEGENEIVSAHRDAVILISKKEIETAEEEE